MTFAQLVESAASLAFQIAHTTNAEVVRGLTVQLRWIDAQIAAWKGNSQNPL